MQELEDPNGAAICLGFLSSILIDQKKYKNALDVSDKCLKLYGQMNNPFLAAYYGYFLKGKALARMGEAHRKEALECLQKAYEILWSIGDNNYINQVKDELKYCNVRVLQVVLDDSIVENLYITRLTQKITQQSVQENYIKSSGETIHEDDNRAMSAEQVVLRGVVAKSVIIEEINQIIEQTFIEHNYSVSSEHFESLLEKAIDKIAPNADPEVRKSLALQMIRVCLEDEQSSIPSEQRTFILDKLSEMGIQQFQALLSSEEEYRNLRKRLGWLIARGRLNGCIVGIGIVVVAGTSLAVGMSIRSAYDRKHIEDLNKIIDDLRKVKGRDPDSLSPNQPDQEDTERSSKKRSSDEDVIKSRGTIKPNPGEQSSQSLSLAKAKETSVYAASRKSGNTNENAPQRVAVSGGGGGGGSISSGENSLQWFEDTFGGEQIGGFMDISFGEIDLIPTSVFDSITDGFADVVIGGVGEGIFGGIDFGGIDFGGIDFGGIDFG